MTMASTCKPRSAIVSVVLVTLALLMSLQDTNVDAARITRDPTSFRVIPSLFQDVVRDSSASELGEMRSLPSYVRHYLERHSIEAWAESSFVGQRFLSSRARRQSLSNDHRSMQAQSLQHRFDSTLNDGAPRSREVSINPLDQSNSNSNKHDASNQHQRYVMDSTDVPRRMDNEFTMDDDAAAPACRVLPVTERHALTELYLSTNGESWLRNDNWLIEENYCTWYGVRCINGTLGGPIVSIDLETNNLVGVLPEPGSSFWRLSCLAILSLGRNRIHGTVTPSLGNLTSLLVLTMYGNELVGTIPHELQNITALSLLDLHENRLNGSVRAHA